MKKVIFAMAAGAMILASCGNGTPSAKLENSVDTLSYYLGVAQTQGLNEYMTMQLGVDSTCINDFIRGINDAVNAGDNKQKQAYFAGLQIGAQIKNQMFRQINYQLAGKDSVEVLSVKNFMAAFCTATKGDSTLFSMQEVQDKIQPLMQQVQQEYLIKLPENKKNKEDGEKFLADNAKKEGVTALPSGLQYKVLTAGNGEKPAEGQGLKIKYEGKLIDGTVFDSNMDKPEPATMNPNSVIPGFGEALKLMKVGDKWEIYIPQELAYGSQQTGNIKPFSALIFTVEIVGVDAPAAVAQPAPIQ